MEDTPDDWEYLPTEVPAFSTWAVLAQRLTDWSGAVLLVRPAFLLVTSPYMAPGWVCALAAWPRKPGTLRAILVARTLRRAGRDPEWAEALASAYALGGLGAAKDLAAAAEMPEVRWRFGL